MGLEWVLVCDCGFRLGSSESFLGVAVLLSLVES